MHSFSFYGEPEYGTITPDKYGIVEITFGEYGRGYEKYTNPIDKANYIATGLFNTEWPGKDEMERYPRADNLYEYKGDNPDILKFEEVIKDQTNCKVVLYRLDNSLWSWDEYGFIDHQSTDVWQDMFADLGESIFRRWTLEIDNDNH